jgi:hypothetical protein
MSDVVDGRFTLETLLGAGTFGEAHRAHDRDGKPVVVKLVHAHLLAIEGIAERFRREVLALERLRHPHVVTLVASGSCAKRGQLYYVMEWSPGEPLDRIVARGPLPVERARPLVAQLASALVAAHELGIVHRDLKPGNLLVEDAGSPGERVRVLDFGLAKHLQGGERTRKELTQGAAIGTPLYMSPEQYQGTATVPASDLYAVGCILMELLTGKPPFEARTVGQLMAKHLREPAPRLDSRLKGAPADLVDLVARCLAKAAADRPTAKEVREALGAEPEPADPVRAKLDLGARRVLLFGGTQLRFGRNGSRGDARENDLVLRAFPRPGETREAVEKRSLDVSGKHGRFLLARDRVTIADLGSTRGTELDGHRLVAHAATPTGDGFRLGVGGAVTLRGRVFRREGAVVALLLTRDGDGEHVSYVLAPGEVSIGPGAVIEAPAPASVDSRGGRVQATGVEVLPASEADMKPDSV